MKYLDWTISTLFWAVVCGLWRGMKIIIGGNGKHLDRCPNRRLWTGWETRPVDPEHVHVIPCNDHMTHDGTEDCWCGPRPEPVVREDGEVAWMLTHHSLDGREFAERGQTIPKEVP